MMNPNIKGISTPGKSQSLFGTTRDYRMTNSSKLTLRLSTSQRTTHINLLTAATPFILLLRPKEYKFPPTFRTPPHDTAVRTLNIHLSTTESFPESVHAYPAHSRIRNEIDQFGGEGEPFLQVFHLESGKGVD